jgi:transitional endoplasmic reticulum ATPase
MSHKGKSLFAEELLKLLDMLHTTESKPPKESEKAMATEKERTLDDATKARLQAVEVVHHEGKLMIPQQLSLEDARDAIQERIKSLKEVITVVEMIDAFPWDAAISVAAVLKARFGWQPTPDASISVEVGYNKTTHAPWGSFKVVGIDAQFSSDITMKDKRLIAQYVIRVTGRHAPIVREIFEDARKHVREHSIYRGKAFQMRFHDEKNNKLPLPEIKFLDVSKIDASRLSYSKEVADQIETSLFTPIRRVREFAANGIPIKRGTLLHGRFGTGKTLAAGVAAKLAVAEGMTYIYVPECRDLAMAIQFSANYQDPAALVFAEDIDRTMSGERDVDTDAVLNVLDGVDSKSSRLMVILTSNDIDAIEPALLRPGRLDAVIEVKAPDAEAAGRLARIYGGDTLAPDIDLKKCGEMMAGMIPAVIAEVMQRAKLSQLRRTDRGAPVTGVSTEAVVEAAAGMRSQLALINREDTPPMELDEAVAVLAHTMDRSRYTVNNITKRRADHARHAGG